MKNKENTLGANKQMAFLTTTKLAVVLKRTLLALVLCTLSIPYANAKKYKYYYYDAQLTVQTKDAAAGKIFVSGTELTSPPSQGQDIASLILQDPNTYSNVTSSGGGMVSFYVYAIPEAGYIFKGWSSSPTIFENIEVNTNKYSIPAGNYNNVTKKDASPYSQSNAGAESFQLWNSYEYYSATNSQTIYAWFEAKQTNFNVTFAAAKGGGYYTYKNGDGADTTATGQVVTLNGTTVTTLTPTANERHKFFGWYISYDNGDTFNLLSKSSELTHTFDRQAIVYAQFIPSDAALFIIKEGDGTEYWNLNEACKKALSLSLNVVLPKEDGTLYPLVDGELCTSIPEGETVENYKIPSGVTLLIPYDGNYNLHDDAKRISAANNAPSCFRTLHMALGTEIIVQGRLEVGGVQNNGGQTNTAIGAPRAHGKIRMANGSSITLEDKSHLYCWGYIVGAEDNSEGTITAESGSQIDECLQLRDWKGGSASVEIQDNSYGVFPINQYYAQNIEVSITYLYGAKSFVSTGMFVVVPENIPFLGGTTFYGNADHVKFIGNSKNDGLFNLVAEGSFLTRDYDELTDRMIYQLNGDFSFDELNIQMDATFTNVNIESKKFLLPIVNNMTLHIKSGTTTVNSKLLLSPGAEIYIQKDAKAIANKDIYVFDKDQWLGYEGTKIFPLLYANETEYAATASGTKKQYIRQWKDVQDAKICVDGTLQITENLYTTESGADICSTDTGKVIFNKEAPEPGVVYQVTNQTPTYESETANPAWLHNDKTKNPNYHYTQTSGAAAGDEFTYSETYGRWRCERTITWDANGGTIEPTTTIVGRGEPLSLYFPESLPIPTKTGYTFMGWFTAAIDGTQITTETVVDNNVTYYAQWTLSTIGTPLDIVDADNSNMTLTINTNGWSSSGWPYTVNGVKYEKGDRKADRTLVIPYGDKAPNEEIVIEVKDKEGTVVSYNMYIVPFVDPDTEDLSAINENSSIVFVKSGTLSIEGTASAKEIYVAPGAALQVNENGTLNVEKLVLRTTPFDAAILTNNGTIAGQVYYSRIARDTDFHLFAIPAGSNTAKVVLSDGTSAAVASTVAPYGNAWQLREYNTARRAEAGADGANWDNIGVNADKITYSDVAIETSKGYELRSGSKYYREYLFPVTLPTTATSVQVTTATGAAGAADAGWNILCSPYTGIYTVENYNDPATAIKVCWQQKNGSYIQELPKQIKPAVPFAYQASQTGTLAFDTNFTFAASAPRKQSAAEALTETEWVHLDIFDAYGEGDETSLFVHPTRFEHTYKTGIDLAKQSLTAPRPIIYSTHAYGDMAFAGVADSLLENGIDLVVCSPAAQELTFSLRENKFLHRLEYLWLADNETGARTDLLMDDYTCRANAGTIKGRFVLNGRFKAPQISTGIGNIQTDYNIYAIGNNIAISGVEQGTSIYVFDAVGHMIYTTSATSDEVIVPAPCAGVYMLTIGGQTAKLVVNQ